jgi:hypothetical protein
VNKVKRETGVKREKRVLWAPLVSWALWANRASLEKRVNRVKREKREIEELLAKMVLRVNKEQLVLKENKVKRVSEDQLVQMEL